jgi:hypothetical protein
MILSLVAVRDACRLDLICRSSWDADTTNPTAMIMHNSSGAFTKGSCVLMYRGCAKGCSVGERIGIASSADGEKLPLKIIN